eukprot:scpid63679/ scgid27085/ Zinc finger FYVE domain-containing protein 21
MAQEVHRNLVLTKGGTKAVATDEASRSLFDLGEPPWVKDEEAARCSNCQTAFTFFVRKHHCRFCGDLYCSKCSPSAVPSLRQGYIDPVRLCEDCRTVVAKDNEFIQKHLPVLVTGAMFIVNETPTLCCISSAHRDLTFGEEHDPVSLQSIHKVEDIQNDAGNVTGVRLACRSAGAAGVEASLELHVDNADKNKKRSLMFIGCLKRGLQVLHGPTPTSPRKKKAKEMKVEQ